MEVFVVIDWRELLIPSHSLAEIFIRGTTIYLCLFFALRFLLKRQSGEIGITDLLVVVLIADAAQNAMSDQYNSLTEGLVLVSTIIFWDLALNWLAFTFPRLGKVLRPPPLALVRNGQMVRGNMRRELISPNELMSQLREHGVERLEEVKLAYMEGDGQISVIRSGASSEPQPPSRHKDA